MKFKSINRTVLHDNIFQLLFVFTAFAVMAFAANFFIGRILIDHALHGAQAQLVSAEANINAGFTKAETTLLNSSYIIREMTERNVSGQELVNYITATSKWLGLRDQGQSGFSALYAYINGEIYNGTGLAPGDGFDPKEQPWYQTAMECGDLIAYTAPYTDKRTGNAIISVVKNILGSNGEQLGILVVDLNTGWLEDYVKSFSITPGGYGILLGRNITIMAHPDSNLLGHPLEDMGGAYGEIARTLKNGQDVLGRRIKNPDGGSVVVFFREIFNGWYVGNVVPFDMFYRDLHISAMILAILGVTLAAALCGILLRLSAAKHRSDEESKYKSSFIANMSHEIRTPMNAITGMAELLLREDLPQKSRDYIIDIRQASVSLLAIINDLLDFSKIESGKLEIVSGRYDLPSLVNNVMSIINIRLMEKPIEFVSSIDADVPAALIGDEVRIQEVLINLLSNAVKYTNIGQIRLNIACEQWEVPQNQEEPREKKIWLKMDVCDTGIGIKTEDREKIFRTYIQADKHKNRKIEGTGLGLPITSMLCKAMGGSINFRSEYGKGSTFTVRIPQEIQTDGTGLPENRQGFLAPGKITSFTIPDSRILVADDILTNLKVSEGLLEPYKAKIDTCISGREAVELARKNKYDIIFMDHMMPEMDGIEATAAIRTMENNLNSGSAYRQIPIIALTANVVSGMKEMFLSKGFDDFLAKPIDVFKLETIIKKWIPAHMIYAIPESGPAAPQSQNPVANTPLNTIPGINAAEGLQMTGGTIAGYCRVLSMFCTDVRERIQEFGNITGECGSGAFTGKQMTTLITQFHALKSAGAAVGAVEISAEAARLEDAGRAGNKAYVADNLDGFASRLNELAENISSALDSLPEDEIFPSFESNEDNDTYDYDPVFSELDAALQSKNAAEIDRIIGDLDKKPMDTETRQTLEQISKHILLADYESARAVINSSGGKS